MNAKEAREISEKNKKTIITRYVRHIDNRIGNAARTGTSSIHNPQIGLPKNGDTFYINGDILTDVKNYYINLGYIWNEYPDPYGDSHITLKW